ncbi:MAG: D-2-hydroxyacid dehydrogenase [Oscillospiraceae bacterium]|nr:D-2-hydroxyacid dehydrogenase [Oscillospiraceae bacterium]
MNLLIISDSIFNLNDEEISLLQSLSPNADISYCSPESVTDEHFAQAEVIFGWPRPDRLSLAKNLKWLHTPSAGVDTYLDRSIFANQDIVITRSKDVFNVQIAEHVIMLFLAISRGLFTSVSSTIEKKWTMVRNQKELSSSTVMVVGTGAIGNELAKQLQGFGCKIIGVKRDKTVIPPNYSEICSTEELDDNLPFADYIALCLPRTPETIGMFDYRRFSLMKPSAILVNIGRGDAVVTDDIDRALRNGLIYGAGLDVTEPEPLPEEHPLWSAPNTIITSHTSGWSINADKRRLEVFVDLWTRYNTNHALHSIVDSEKGY